MVVPIVPVFMTVNTVTVKQVPHKAHGAVIVKSRQSLPMENSEQDTGP